MPDWNAYVRARLWLHDVRPQQEQDVVDDLAGQLEDAYREAIARGLSPEEAEAVAADHIRDWARLARELASSRIRSYPLTTAGKLSRMGNTRPVSMCA